MTLRRAFTCKMAHKGQGYCNKKGGWVRGTTISFLIFEFGGPEKSRCVCGWPESGTA